jgi:hypothetical protein
MDSYHCGRRNPHKIRTDETNIAIPTVPNPAVTKFLAMASRYGHPLCAQEGSGLPTFSLEQHLNGGTDKSWAIGS